ncbi:MAG: hypothetical protein A2X31_03040 [Elusimicrobia bacterium GWB2_63_22]|nr:MAG: hypothetical protein A2X31_03040 [Elusimicrobia bacterium GWB2_63_22]
MKFKALLLKLAIVLSCAAPAHAGDFAVPSFSSGRFLLLDRQDSEKILSEQAVSTAPEAGGLDSVAGDLPFSYTQDSWNSAREAVETGRFRGEELAPLPAVEVSTDTPLSPEPQVEFRESGTSLSVTGRKVIAVNYSGKRYIADQTNSTRARSLSLFEITQQMQVRMQGKVGAKISVNVDYDDTKQDKQDISVVYQGDPNEVVQNVSFGDIDLSLPATEFVSYNKQLFGIRADLRTKSFKFTFVGSRTKGDSKTKQFTGNTQFQKADINDISYLRRKYYDLTFGNTARLPIKANSEKVYIDRQNSAAVDNVTVFAMTGSDLGVQTSSYTGRFQLMSRGVDYVMDYANGILTFSSTLDSDDVVLMDFQNANNSLLSANTSTSTLDTGGDGLFKIVKSKDDVRISTPAETGYRRELKTYYSIGQTNIVRDNGTGNFSLKVQDLSHNDVGSSLNPQQMYADDRIIVDFEQGIFHLKQPFGADGDPDTPDPQVYAATPASKRLFHVEYNYRFKTFTLDASIVLNSEVVTVDNGRYTRNVDYFIDYESGFITFYYPEKIGQDSKIDITYEVSQYGGTGNQSLVGGRASYDFGSHFSLGTTLLYQGGIKSNSVPNVSDLVNSMLVYEGDAQLKGMNLLGIRTSLGGEVAQSKTNPNLNDFALIDNMEGVKQDDSAPLDKNYWVIAANPPGLNRPPADPRAVGWANENVKAREINAASSSEGSQQVLTVSYDFSISTEVSIAYPLSLTGLDFSQKKTLEMIVYGQGSGGPQLNIHYGQIDEDADGRGGQNFTCSSGLTLYGYPKSEDLNCDSQVSTSEDIGWLYAPEGLEQRRYGASNGRLDSQDLNRNGRLDGQDFTGGDFGYENGSTFVDTTDLNAAKNVINFSGWHTLSTQMPITSTNSFNWNAVKQVRVSLKKPVGLTCSSSSVPGCSGVVKFARISAVGNTWAVFESTSGGGVQVSAINNIDNTDYNPIYNAGGDAARVFDDLYGSVSEQKQKSNSATLSEQTLRISYSSVTAASSGYVYRNYSQALDISQHETLRFLINNAGVADANAKFFLRAGGDASYFKVSVPLDFTGWRLIELRQEDLTKDSIPDMWVSNSIYNITVSSAGTASLQQVSQLRVGVESADATQRSGTVYFNELHVKDPIVRTGNARKVEGTVELPGWFSAGGKHRYVDRSFQTPVTAVANQDNELSSAYMNLTRISFFPVNVTAARQITVTPNAAATGANNLVTVLQEGKVKKFDGTASGSLNVGVLPKIGLNYTKGITDYTLLSRKDDRDTYAANMSYSLPGSLPILPRTVNASYSLSRSLVNYDAARLSNLSGLYDTDERTDLYSGKLSFVPWRGSTFNPGYSLQTVREKKSPLANPAALETYPKSMQQTVDFNSNLLFARWLNPSVNYSVTTIENNNLTATTVTVAQSSQVFTAGEIKTVTRSAQGGVSMTVSFNDLVPKSRLLRSLVLSSNYQIQDGDSWYYVEKEYNTRSKLWLRDPLAPANPFAQRNSLTLRDTVSSTQRWQPFEGYGLKGAAAALNTLSVTNNFSNSVQRSEVTGTVSKSINRTFPDMILSLSQLELLTRTRRWAQNATMNLKYSKNRNEAVSISVEQADSYGMDLRFKLLNFVDTAASYNLKTSEFKEQVSGQITRQSRHDDLTLQGSFDYRKVRFTPKADYVSDVSKGALGVTTSDTKTITPSLLIKSDFQLPKGLKLPFMKQVLLFTNRIVWTTTLSYAIKSSPITIADNNRLFSLNSSADYEAAKNLRLTFNAGLQRLWHKFLKEEEYISYQAGSTLTFQF